MEKGEGRDGAKAKSEIQGWGKSRVRNPGEKERAWAGRWILEGRKNRKMGGPRKDRGKRGQGGVQVKFVLVGNKREGCKSTTPEECLRSQKRGEKAKWKGRQRNPISHGRQEREGRGEGEVCHLRGGRWVCPTRGYRKKTHRLGKKVVPSKGVVRYWQGTTRRRGGEGRGGGTRHHDRLPAALARRLSRIAREGVLMWRGESSCEATPPSKASLDPRDARESAISFPVTPL